MSIQINYVDELFARSATSSSDPVRIGPTRTATRIRNASVLGGVIYPFRVDFLGVKGVPRGVLHRIAINAGSLYRIM